MTLSGHCENIIIACQKLSYRCPTVFLHTNRIFHTLMYKSKVLHQVLDFFCFFLFFVKQSLSVPDMDFFCGNSAKSLLTCDSWHFKSSSPPIYFITLHSGGHVSHPEILKQNLKWDINDFRTFNKGRVHINSFVPEKIHIGPAGPECYINFELLIAK